jgi:hypothetical protein
LLSDIRSAVVGRVFTFQPRRIEVTPTEVAEVQAEAVPVQAQQGKKKKKRKRH